MNSFKNTLSIVLIILANSVIAQQASFGITYGIVMEEGRDGSLWTADVRYQLSSKSAFHLEVSRGDFGQLEIETVEETNVFNNTVTTTTTVNEDRFTSAELVYGYKVWESGGACLELQAGGGAYKSTRKKYFGLLKGGIFISAQLSKHIVAGIPIAYHFVTWQRDYYVTTGASVRYHF